MKTPLEGLRILELGHFVAAPFCTRLLADLGADVIKVEPKQGDPVRQWGDMVDGHSLWWSVHGLNKRCVTLDFKSEKGRALVLRLVAQCDAVVENFRPGHLEKLGLGPAVMRGVKPGLIITHISGYGQDGPDRDRAAFGVIGEAIGGLRYLTNHPPGISVLPPVRVGVSIGDSISGIYAAFGLMAALWHRDRVGGDGQARTVDAALTESVLSLMEGLLPEYGALGKIREPSGGGLATAAPSNAYPSRDGCWVLIGANSEPLFAKLAKAMGQPELAEMACYQGNKARVENVAALDALITQWTRKLDAQELLARLNEADIPSSKAYTAADCAADPQYIARGMVRRVEDGWFGTEVLHPGIVPHVPEAPGTVRWTGPRIGAHNDEVYGGLLGLPEAEIAALRAEGVI